MTIGAWAVLTIIVAGISLALVAVWMVPTRGDRRANWPGSQTPDADPPVNHHDHCRADTGGKVGGHRWAQR